MKDHEFSRKLISSLSSLDNNKKIILSNFFCGRVNKKFPLISFRGSFLGVLPESLAQQKNWRRSARPSTPKGPWVIDARKGGGK
jgi:hypothetical protein